MKDFVPAFCKMVGDHLAVSGFRGVLWSDVTCSAESCRLWSFVLTLLWAIPCSRTLRASAFAPLLVFLPASAFWGGMINHAMVDAPGLWHTAHFFSSAQNLANANESVPLPGWPCYLPEALSCVFPVPPLSKSPHLFHSSRITPRNPLCVSACGCTSQHFFPSQNGQAAGWSFARRRPGSNRESRGGFLSRKKGRSHPDVRRLRGVRTQGSRQLLSGGAGTHDIR